MGRARELTEKTPKRATPGRGKGAFKEYWDLPVRGLFARVGKRGIVWWFRSGAGSRRIKIGPWPKHTVSDARSIARRLRGRVEAERQGLRTADPLAPTLGRAIDLYEDTGCPSFHEEGEPLKHSTWRNYKAGLSTVFGHLFKKSVAAIRPAEVEDAMSGEDYSLATGKKAVRALRTIYAFCQRRKWVRDDPTDGIKTSSKTKNSFPELTEDQVRLVLDAALNGRPKIRNCFFLLTLASCVRPSMVRRIRAANILEDGAKLTWDDDQTKMGNVVTWFPGPKLRPLVQRLAAYDAPFWRGSERKTESAIYDHHRRTLDVPVWFKSSQKTGSTWWQETATMQKANGEDPGASITDIPYTAQLMTAHTPANITAKIYTARIFEVARPDLEKASIVLEDRIAEVTGIDFTDRAVLDVLCPLSSSD